MELADVTYSGSIQTTAQTNFTGLNHRRSANDGDLWDMKNMCSRDYPVLSTRPRRRKYQKLMEPHGLYSWDGLVWVDGTGLYHRGDKVGTVEESDKVFAGIGNYVVVFPDKVYFNSADHTFGHMESTWKGESLTFMNGTLYEESAEANTIKCEGVSWADYFNEGDAVTISGCTIHTENNKTPIIREIDGDEMHFYENVFTLDDSETAVSSVDYTETGDLQVARTVPDMDYIFENENRLWGCKGNEIYASKLGDIFNWNVFDGLSTDSYATDVGSANTFCGACAYSGYPTFFKEDRIYKMYGNYPSNYQLMGSATLGMKEGCAGSLAIAGETLFYLSRAGFTAYTGGVPNPISDVFGDLRFYQAVAGSDGLNYYCATKDADDEWRLLVYDTENNVWSIEDDFIPKGFTWYGSNLYALDYDGQIWIMGNPENANDYAQEDSVEWMVETADYTAGSPDTKLIRKILLRMELESDATAQVWMQYDSDGEWHRSGEEMVGERKRSYMVAVKPRRCDHYRIRITGTNTARIYSLANEYSVGSDYHGRRYR